MSLVWAPPLGEFIFFGDLVCKNIAVSQSDRMAPQMHQNTESFKFSIGQNNLSRKFILKLTNCPMGVIAWRTGFTRPKGATGDTPINTVVHIRLFTLFPMFGTRNPNGRWPFRPGVGSFLRRGFRVTQGVDGGVSGFGGVRYAVASALTAFAVVLLRGGRWL